MSRICIVTPDTVGPVKNGGIGTHAYNLALYWARLKHDVTLLLTTPYTESDKKHWRSFYKAQGVRFQYLSDFPDLPSPVQLPSLLSISLKIFEALRHETFDQIHFQDWLANGFHCIQAKCTLDCFPETLLTVTAHSSTEWINEGMQQWNTARLEGTKLMWAERYCVEHCDVLISPSAYMLHWMRDREWQLSRQQVIIPYLFFKEHHATPYSPEKGVLAFFGRLETRKGLKIFCDGLNRLLPEDLSSIHRLLFVGKEGMCENLPALTYIKAHLSRLAPKIEFHTDLDTFAAQNLLRTRKAVAFLPSLMDNLPYSGIECVENGIPAFAANNGGFAEIFPKERLFEPTATGVAAALTQALHGALESIPGVYNVQRAKQGWKDLAEKRIFSSHSIEEQPFVSVCISHYNHGAYLPEALHSLARQDYPNFEVIVIDDGSTDPLSKEVFHSLGATLDKRFKFYEKENEGLAKTRNICATTYAQGEYLIFCDADNIFEPGMVSALVAATQHGGLDVASCHCLGFTQTEKTHPRIPSYRYAPLGADLVSGILENVFGDANFIIKKSVFLELEGFKDTRNSWEDWDILARAVLRGKTLDVLPTPLFWYRVTKTGMTKTTSQCNNHRMVLESYGKYLPSFARRALRDLLVPASLHQGLTGYENSVIVTTFLRWGMVLENAYGKISPHGSVIQKSATWIRHILCSGRQLR